MDEAVAACIKVPFSDRLRKPPNTCQVSWPPGRDSRTGTKVH